MNDNIQMEHIDELLAQLKDKKIEEKVCTPDEEQAKEGVSIIKKCVDELLEIDDLEAERKKDEEKYDNRILTIVSWYNYLKRTRSDEIIGAKDLIMCISKKHPKLTKWCMELIN